MPTQIKPLYEAIFKTFRIDGDSQLDICIGLSLDIVDSKAYKFCKEEYLGQRLSKYKRGVHIMTEEEIQKEDEAARLNYEKELKEKESLLAAEGISIYDILQPTQGNQFEPVVEFATPQE